MQDVTVHMWLPIKSHADWQPCIFLIRKKCKPWILVVDALLTEPPLLIMFQLHHP